MDDCCNWPVLANQAAIGLYYGILKPRRPSEPPPSSNPLRCTQGSRRRHQRQTCGRMAARLKIRPICIFGASRHTQAPRHGVVLPPTPAACSPAKPAAWAALRERSEVAMPEAHAATQLSSTIGHSLYSSCKPVKLRSSPPRRCWVLPMDDGRGRSPCMRGSTTPR